MAASEKQREQWRKASLAYYHRIASTRHGRMYFADYKRWRRRLVRAGKWPNKAIPTDARV